ncbi:unnamed protein product [Amoebophrya sp. A120]|nr:unnamed protein product [Amoebophrya sp. A120]|eukprot:GSA120T00012892001.1
MMLKTVFFLSTAINGSSALLHKLREMRNSKTKNQVAALSDKISFNGEEIFGSELAGGSKSVETCYKTSRVDKLESVKVCGVNMKVVIYLPNDCLAKDPHNVEVGVCDGGKPSTTCTEITADKKGDNYWIDSALSYMIMPCDVSQEASVDDAPAINGTALL